MTVPFKERRAFRRLESSAPIAFVLEREPWRQHEANSKNISVNCICFEGNDINALLDVGDRITIQLQTIFGSVAVAAVVVRKAAPEVACQFVDVNPDVAEKIKNWLFPPFEP